MAEIIRFQVRRGTAAEWAQVNPVLADGEQGLEKDTGRHKFGNGVSPWTALPYAAPGPEGPPNTDASLLSTGTVPDGRLPSRLSDAQLSATYVSFKNFDGTPVVGKHVEITLTADGTDIDNIRVVTP